MNINTIARSDPNEILPMICQLCTKDKKLIKAHIIPEGFFRELRTGERAPELHTNTTGIYPKRVPIGIYDKNILCADCDGIFGPWDSHAQNVLLHHFSEDMALYHDSKKVGYRIANFDYTKLKLFFVSLLWRAAISRHSFYKRISLGPFEPRIKEMILSGDPGSPHQFAVTIAKFSDPDIPAMLDPHRDRFEGINYCRFYLAGFVAYVKVDKRPPPSFMEHFCLRAEAPITVISRDPRGSKDVSVLKAIFKTSVLRKRT